MDVARTHGEVKYFTCSHENALQCCLMPLCLDVLNGCNDEWCRDFVNLASSEGFDEIALQSSTFVGVTHDAAFL